MCTSLRISTIQAYVSILIHEQFDLFCCLVPFVSCSAVKVDFLSISYRQLEKQVCDGKLSLKKEKIVFEVIFLSLTL